MNAMKKLCLSLAFVTAAAFSADAQMFTKTRNLGSAELKEVSTIKTKLGTKKTHKSMLNKMFARKKYIKTGVGASLNTKRIKLCAAYR